MPRQRTVFPLVALLSLLMVPLAGGCGPFGYLNKVAKDATKVVEEAEALDAEKYAPYEYWGAVAYLEQAKVLMAYSEYERSFDYGVRAKQLAEEAIKKSQKMEAGQMTESLDNEDSAPAPASEPAGQDSDPNATGDADASGSAKGSISVGGGK